MSRPRPTSTDYVVIALSPILIMALVGSLVFFLLAVFYHGPLAGRLGFIMAMFVMAAVLIGRISIDEGREYAALFALPLGIATVLAAVKFAPVNPLFSVALIGLIWWCADRLTWDCTVIDESQDASSEGLLQTVGIDRDPVADSDEPPSPSEVPSVEATTDREQQPQSFWNKLLESRRRPHRHGVWVIYFSLAALPIFGLGHCLVDAGDLASRRYVFKLLFVYVGAAFGLLLTTSFLRLRHYLRQRRLEMPSDMAGVWMGAGAVMIGVLLILCLLLPRRNPEYSLTGLPVFTDSRDDWSTSRFAFGRDGPQREDADRSIESQDSDTDSALQAPSQQSGDSDSSSGQSQEGKSPEKGKDGSASDDAQDDQSPRKESSPDDTDRKDDGESSEQSATDQQRQPQQQGSGGGKQAGDRSGNEGRKGSQPSAPKRTPNASPSQTPSPTRWLSMLTGGLGRLLRAIYWLIVFVVVGYLLWRYWPQVLAAVREFISSLKQLWERLFGTRSDRHEEAPVETPQDTAPPPRRFADFPDPFLDGSSQRWSIEQLVKYSYEALEAWARERGCQRSPEQTPHEFAQAVAAFDGSLRRPVYRLAELYNVSAFAPQSANASTATDLRQLWQLLEARRG